MTAPEERPPYVLTAHDEDGTLRHTLVSCERIYIEGYAAGLHVQNTDWRICINGWLLYGNGQKEWRIQPAC